MIFCTVGTHEDPFDRLLVELDRLRANGALDEEVVIQSGYSKASTPHCRSEAMIGFDQMGALMDDARIIITHGGPATIMQALERGKVPVVVPRQSAHGEHVDDHQVRFSRKIEDRVIVVLDIDTLGRVLSDYDALAAQKRAAGAGGAAQAFAQRFEELCRLVIRGGDPHVLERHGTP